MKTFVLFNVSKNSYLESTSDDYYKATGIRPDSNFTFTFFAHEAIKYASLDNAQEQANKLSKYTKDQIEVRIFND